MKRPSALEMGCHRDGDFKRMPGSEQQAENPVPNFPTESTEVTPTATGQQVLQKHQVHWA